jgi:REP-associated tyrosine transposase
VSSYHLALIIEIASLLLGIAVWTRSAAILRESRVENRGAVKWLSRGCKPTEPSVECHGSRAAATSFFEGEAMAGTYTKLFYHLVFSTKNRQQFIAPSIEEELRRYIAGILRNIEGSCVEINGMPDHVHILAIVPPKISVSDALRTIKASSSKWVHETKPELAMFAWQDGYSAFTVSKSQVNSVREYISDQKAHHAERDFKAELLGLLAKHEVEFDERYIWD